MDGDPGGLPKLPGGEAKLRATLDQSVAKARTFSGDDTTVAVLYRAPEGAP